MFWTIHGYIMFVIALSKMMNWSYKITTMDEKMEWKYQYVGIVYIFGEIDLYVFLTTNIPKHSHIIPYKSYKKASFSIQNLCCQLLAGHCKWASACLILWEHKTRGTQQCSFLLTTKFMSLATSSAFVVVILLPDFMWAIKFDGCQLTSVEVQFNQLNSITKNNRDYGIGT